jgi:hypothetical protein
MRNELMNQLDDVPGVVSVGFARRDGDTALLVAVDDSFHDDVPETFEGIRVIVENLGEARVNYNGETPP